MFGLIKVHAVCKGRFQVLSKLLSDHRALEGMAEAAPGAMLMQAQRRCASPPQGAVHRSDTIFLFAP